MGAAETGSGKTLAFGLPILNGILRMKENLEGQSLKPLFALILTPTRELAFQVRDHLETAARFTGLQLILIVIESYIFVLFQILKWQLLLGGWLL